MSGFELNKIAASILLGGLIAMLVGSIVDILYKPNLTPIQKGYQVAVTEDATNDAAQDTPPSEETLDIKELMKTASAEAGKGLITRCTACHSVDKGGPNKVGPNLWGVVGQKLAAHEGYNYSSALKAKGGTWDYDSLAHFLHKPGKFIPGTKMSFAGIAKPQDIANLIAYLREQADSLYPLP